MKPAQQITALRKDGQLDEAHRLAVDILAAHSGDDHVAGAYAWVLIDLVKRHSTDHDQGRLQEYIRSLIDLHVPSSNELLIEHRRRAVALNDVRGRAIAAARKIGKDGQHDEAVRAFARLHAERELEGDERIGYGWELFRANQDALRALRTDDPLPSHIDAIKRRLNAYLKLRLPGGEMLHSCMLQQALRLSDKGGLRLIAFVRLWDLDGLRDEDCENGKSADGKVFASLAEQVIQRAAKEAAKDARTDEMQYILPYVELGMKRFPDNVWLKFNMVKLLRNLDRPDDARSLAVEFARTKTGDYWAWELLGDVQSEVELRTACYAKALSCPGDDAFTGKVRLKFANLVRDQHPQQAKAEIERIVDGKRRDGLRIPTEVERIMQSPWFAAVVSLPADRAFYDRFKGRAEELLFSHLPWTTATIGDQFVIEGQDGQKDRRRRRIYLWARPLALEVSVSASHPDLRGRSEGDAVKVQKEASPGEPWKTIVHRIASRAPDDTADVITSSAAVIDHVNPGKGLFHFIGGKDIDGTCRLSDYPDTPLPGASVLVRLVRYQTRKGARTRVLSIVPFDHLPSSDVYRSFDEVVEVRSGMGFTSSGIFLPLDVVAASRIEDGDQISGSAVINFNQKRSTWGWKAVTVST